MKYSIYQNFYNQEGRLDAPKEFLTFKTKKELKNALKNNEHIEKRDFEGRTIYYVNGKIVTITVEYTNGISFLLAHDTLSRLGIYWGDGKNTMIYDVLGLHKSIKEDGVFLDREKSGLNTFTGHDFTFEDVFFHNFVIDF